MRVVPPPRVERGTSRASTERSDRTELRGRELRQRPRSRTEFILVPNQAGQPSPSSLED